MLRPIFSALLLLTLSTFAADLPAQQVQNGEPVYQPDLQAGMPEAWKSIKGRWEAKGGVLQGTELPEDKHSAVLHMPTVDGPMVVECEFRMGKSRTFYVGCDGQRHVGRLVIVPKEARLAEDSTETKEKKVQHTLATAKLDLKPEEWQPLRLEYSGEQLAAQVGEQKLQASHPYLASPKVRWWFASSGEGLELRNIRVSKGVAVPR